MLNTYAHCPVMVGVPRSVVVGVITAAVFSSVVTASSLGGGLGTVTNHDDRIYHCAGTGPQESLDINETMGMWYTVEVVHHRYDSKFPKGESSVDTCPMVHLMTTHDSLGRDNGIRLMWSENAGNLVYHFNVDTVNRPGFWISSGAQNGSMTALTTPYRQFAGIVEVTKAVGNHMVLTFCMPGQQLFSIVMSREKSLPAAELRGVNSLLERKGLVRVATREACRNSARMPDTWHSLVYSFFVIVFLSLINRT